jgi:hypothetical protein
MVTVPGRREAALVTVVVVSWQSHVTMCNVHFIVQSRWGRYLVHVNRDPIMLL